MKRVEQKIRLILRARKQRQHLLAMDEQIHKDLAISRVDAEQLAGRYKTEKTHEKKWRDPR